MKKIAISLLALTLAVFLAVPAMAEFDPYGSIRLGVFQWNQDNPPGTDDDSDLKMPHGNYSRFGAKFQTGDISGHVELGLKGAEDGDTVYERLLYGTWDFGDGTLLVGQDYCPYTHISAQVAPGFYDLENYFIGYGCLWNSRQPQLRMNLENGFYAALIRPQGASAAAAQTAYNAATAAAVADMDQDVTLPKICVGYKVKMDNLTLNPGFAYNTMKYESQALNKDWDVDSWLLYVNGKVGLGMVDLKWSIHTGQNLGDFGISNRTAAANARFNAAGKVEDSDCMGYYLQASYKLDPATINVGYGYAEAESDLAGQKTDDQSSYFVNCKLPIAETFFVVPEISFYDDGDGPDGKAEKTDVTVFGVLCQMNF